MTREEFEEDIVVGDILRIRTADDEVIGRVDSLGETSVKIIRLDTGRPRRIAYEFILDFDYCDDVPQTSADAGKDNVNEPAPDELAATAEEKSDNDSDNNIVENKGLDEGKLSSALEIMQAEAGMFVGVEKDVKSDIQAEEIQTKEMPEPQSTTISGMSLSLMKAEQLEAEAIERTLPDGVKLAYVYYYDKERKYGFLRLKAVAGKTVYFYINQVKDVELQRRLEIEDSGELNVTCRIGENFTGKKAAYEVELYRPDGDKQSEESVKEVLDENSAYHGWIDNFNNEKKYGIIRTENKTYKFILGNVSDVQLRKTLNKGKIKKGYEIAFKLKNYINKKTNQTEKVACDIETWVNKDIQGLSDNNTMAATQAYDNAESSKEAFEKAVKYANFKPYPYEPLKPYSEKIIAMQEADIPGIGDEDKQACAILLKDELINPYDNLEEIPKDDNYFQEGWQYQRGSKDEEGNNIGVDYDKAEEFFIKAIKANDRRDAAVANLISIFLKRGGSEINKGLMLLEVFGDLFTKEKLLDLRFQLIDKSGNFEARELILKYAVKNTREKKNKCIHYMFHLAGVYSKNEKWEKSKECFENCLTYMKNHNDIFLDSDEKFSKMRVNANRLIALANYKMGDVALAKEQAAELLKANANDVIARGIIDDFVEVQATESTVLDEIYIQFDDEFEILPDNDESFSKYVNYRLQKVDYSIFNNMNDVYSKIKDGVYEGTAEDIKNLSSKLSKYKVVKSRDKSELLISIAKIALDTRNNNDEKKLSIESIKSYVGRSIKYMADAALESEKDINIDSLRFYYVQALKYLEKSDNINIDGSLNGLIYSFFLTGKSLLEQRNLSKEKSKRNIEKYFDKECSSIDDFLAITFMLQTRKEYIKYILGKVFENDNMCAKFVEACCNYINQEYEVQTNIELYDLWKKAKEQYNRYNSELFAEITNCVIGYDINKMLANVSNISEIQKKHIMLTLDDNYIESFKSIVMKIAKLHNSFDIEVKEAAFEEVLADIEALRDRIKEYPTELGFEHIFDEINELDSRVREEFKQFYGETIPKITDVSLNGPAYVNNNEITLSICFATAPYKQKIDNVNVSLDTSEGVKFVECQKQFSTILSGDKQEYMARFALNEEAVKEAQFDLTVTIAYRYHSSIDEYSKETESFKLNVVINSKDTFVIVENKYDKIIRGNGVSTKLPEMFKGRGELINSICDSMHLGGGMMNKNRGIILWGQRRVGKNSVKDYLKKQISEKYPGAYIPIDLGNIGKCHNVREILISIVNNTKRGIRNNNRELYNELIEDEMDFSTDKLETSDSYMAVFNEFMAELSDLLEQHSEPETNILLYYFDEFSYLYQWIEEGSLDGEKFMRFWKAFISDYNICAIIIAQDNLPVWMTKYPNEFSCMNYDNEITYLDYKGAMELICEPCQVNGESLFTDDAVRSIYSLTKGSACLIVILCKFIIDYRNNNYIPKITKSVVDIVMEKEFLEKSDIYNSKDFEPQIQDVVNVGDKAEAINAGNRKLLEEIAVKTIDSNMVEVDKLDFLKDDEGGYNRNIYERLKERKIIDTEGDKYCKISMPLLKLQLLRELGELTKENMSEMI